MVLCVVIEMLKDRILIFIYDVLDLADAHPKFFCQRFLTDPIAEPAFQDIPVSFGMNVFVNNCGNVKVTVLLHPFFRTFTRPSPPQFGHFL